MALDQLVDTISLADGLAAAVQSCLVPLDFAQASPLHLLALGDDYARFLARLPLLALKSRPDGGHSLGLASSRLHLPLIAFASPYLAAARGGRELRYPIVGGLLVRAPGGHLAFGVAPEGARARLWIAVAAFHPRLGLGPLYLLSQAQCHRLVTVAYLRQIAPALPTSVRAPS